MIKIRKHVKGYTICLTQLSAHLSSQTSHLSHTSTHEYLFKFKFETTGLADEWNGLPKCQNLSKPDGKNKALVIYTNTIQLWLSD